MGRGADVALTFGMLHLVFKSDGAPPLSGQVPVVLWMGGAVCGEVVQQHHVCAWEEHTTGTKQLVKNRTSNPLKTILIK